MQLAGLLVQEEGDRYAPVALARDAPVGAVGDHRVQARLAPRGVELGGLHGAQRALAQCGAVGGDPVHADEPLRGGAIDERRLVAPAVHVAVGDLAVREQGADLGELVDDRRVGLPDVHAAEEGKVGHVLAAARHQGQDLVVAAAVRVPRVEVVHAVRWRRVHDAGAGVDADVFGEIHRRDAVVEGVAELDAFERRALGGGDDGACELEALQRGFDEFPGEHEQTIADIDQRIVELGVGVERLVGGDGPRGGGPDHRGGGLVEPGQAECGGEFTQMSAGVRVGYRERDIDRRRGLVGIFHLGLGQRRAAVEAPVHRLQALEHVAVLRHLGERADLVGFVGEVHRAVGVVPVAEHAEADEVGLLDLDLLGGVGAAQLTHAVGGQVLAVRHLDLVLDRQAVAVPARNVGRVEAGQRLRAHDDVLEDLVQRVADVQAAVGVGRAVVEHELGPAGAGLADALVELLLLPVGDPVRLAPGQVATHREGGVGQVERLAVVGHGGIGSRWDRRGSSGLQAGRGFAASQSRAVWLSRAICARSASSEGNFCSARRRCRKCTRMWAP
ncbi:MAG: hypothetical protein BWZ09_02552 [Alphaproteobacteria bacterium ADurb.BinA305]|nr:MAG: hypothetical protein BWZ09_02552 [Alphaproteobacteria bacterium ADurb.BinA305]